MDSTEGLVNSIHSQCSGLLQETINISRESGMSDEQILQYFKDQLEVARESLEVFLDRQTIKKIEQL